MKCIRVTKLKICQSGTLPNNDWTLVYQILSKKLVVSQVTIDWVKIGLDRIGFSSFSLGWIGLG